MRFIAIYWVVLLCGIGVAHGQQYGRFEGEVIASWLPDGRSMQLKKPVRYFGPDNVRWDAPAGLVSDGASIPPFFWSIIGGPFSGPYRNAAIIHDRYCETRERPWRQVHEAFYTASRAAGVPETQAQLMYFAVYRFGPRWPSNRSGDTSRIVFRPKIVPGEIADMKAQIARGKITLDEIRTTSDRQLRSLSRSIFE